jgi:hypothetical protein
VFAIGGSKVESPKPLAVTAPAAAQPRVASRPSTGSRATARSLSARSTTPRAARIAIQGGAVPLTLWNANTSNLVDVHGRLLYGGAPVVGARIAVDRYTLPAATDSAGRFTYPVDSTLARRHPVYVVDTSRARLGGRALTTAQERAVRGATGGISVGYRVSGVSVVNRPNGTVVVRGRVLRADGVPAPPVVLLSYRLAGKITDAAGNPVRGATVVTRTNDRDFWTFSDPSDATGRYTGFFPASDKTASDPVEFAVQVANGRTSYTTGARNPTFKRLASSNLDLRLPASGTTMALPTAVTTPGAIYRGLLVGVSGPNGVVKPVSATWPDALGRFTLVLPGSVKGSTLRFWQSDFQSFTTGAVPGGPVVLATWPTKLSPRVSRDTGFVRVPR